MGKRIMRRGKTAQAEQGMTLVEVMVAMAILAIIVTAFLLLSNTTIAGIFTAGAKSKAVVACNQKSDQLYSVITGAADPSAAETALKSTEGYKAAYSDISSSTEIPQFCYTRKTISVTGSDGKTNNVPGFEVTVVVYYSQGKHKVEFESFVLKRT